MTTPARQLDPIKFFEHWKGLPHQRAAVLQMWEKLPEDQRTTAAEWYGTWKADGKQSLPRTLSNPLEVRYFSQLDSRTEHALRMCFSSSCAMLVEALKPGTLPGPNGDDAYLGRVFRYGDTTSPPAQLQVLQYYGIRARLRTDCTAADVCAQIDRGVPVPLGFIHKGGLQSLYGDGHWLIVIGYTADSFIVHDPYGELDLVNGQYIKTWGANLRYSQRNFCPRWEVEPHGSTYRHKPGHGWAIIAEPTP